MLVAFIIVTLVALYLLLPRLAGINQTWGRLQHGDPIWLGAAAGVELLSIVGYAILFRTVFGRGMRRLDWRASIQIPLAGIAAIRLIAAAGAGGVAVTAWALGRAGMESRVIACRMVANLIVQYAVYVGAIFVFGIGLGLGLLPGHGPFELTLLPALLCVVLVGPWQRGAPSRRHGAPDPAHHRGPKWLRAFCNASPAAPVALGEGARTATALIVARRPACSARSSIGASTSPRSGSDARLRRPSGRRR